MWYSKITISIGGKIYMKKRNLLAVLLAAAMLFTSTPVVQAAESEDSGIAPASTLSDIYTIATIGKGRYELYAYTMSLGYVGEASIELGGITYVSGISSADKDNIKNYKKKLAITNGVLTRLSINFSDTIPDETITLEAGVMKGRCRSQSESGAYILYAASHNTLICYGGDWSRSTYHDNPLISVTSETEDETE